MEEKENKKVEVVVVGWWLWFAEGEKKNKLKIYCFMLYLIFLVNNF